MSALPGSAQVVIIGSGFAGAATAYFLAQEGISDIVILDRESTYGVHASGRNAALCRQVTGDEVVTDLTIEGAKFLRHPPAKFSTVPLLSETGSYILCARPPQIEELVDSAEARGLEYRKVELDEVLRRWSRLANVPACGGVHFPTDGVIDIHELLKSYVAGARRGGANVVLGCEVKKFRWSARRPTVLIETSTGNIEATVVVNAAGAWAGEVGRRAGSSDINFTPYHRHLHITERIPNIDQLAPFVWYVGDAEFYVRPEGQNYLVCGCEAVEAQPSDARVMPGATEQLAEKLTPVVPWIADLAVKRSWACLRTFTPDGRPFVGIDRNVPWLYWVAGLGGHGATASPSIGAVAARGLAAHLRNTT